ncbi:MAG: hypothetical protein D8M58_22200 [Calditrichaeota bacterium]|nr:MAG: hypothetical protein DWQ03_08590 [Calditrichota bacterium]MBL1208126.1 hypothetical protein [Calditrichota bacterium]NOG47965.1 hypothetical protein [Calditrichota bacterium]
MGYKLTSLVHLPFDNNVKMYVFSIGDGIWDGGLAEIVHRNFDNIAREIGSNAIIVGALNEAFHGEVVDRYFGKIYKDLKNELPALLITDTHPNDISDDSMKLLIPLRRAHEAYPVIEQFLSDLASFVRGESDDLLKSLEKGVGLAKAANDIVKFNIPIVPGVIGVNLNSAITHLRFWWNDRNNK